MVVVHDSFVPCQQEIQYFSRFISVVVLMPVSVVLVVNKRGTGKGEVLAGRHFDCSAALGRVLGEERLPEDRLGWAAAIRLPEPLSTTFVAPPFAMESMMKL